MTKLLPRVTMSPFRSHARRAKTAYLRSLESDLTAACADLRRLAREQGRDVVTGKIKRPPPW